MVCMRIIFMSEISRFTYYLVLMLKICWHPIFILVIKITVEVINFKNYCGSYSSIHYTHNKKKCRNMNYYNDFLHDTNKSNLPLEELYNYEGSPTSIAATYTTCSHRNT